MELFDLHCDTLINLTDHQEDFIHNTQKICLSKEERIHPHVQTMAIFVPDTLRGEDALSYVDKHHTYFHTLLQKQYFIAEQVRPKNSMKTILQKNKTALILSLESGAALGNRLEKVAEYASKGFAMMTLVWNGENELGSGHDTQKPLSSFGKEVVKEMEKYHMVVDCSHLNDPGFDSLCSIATKPFIATHSNMRKVCPHRRNLTDDQFKEIVRRKGLVGLNLCQPFIDANGLGTKENLFRHVYHMLCLGGEDVIACGSDFDGASIHPSLNTPKKFAQMAEYFSQMGLSDQVIHNIFFHNAYRFFENNPLIS